MAAALFQPAHTVTPHGNPAALGGPWFLIAGATGNVAIVGPAGATRTSGPQAGPHAGPHAGSVDEAGVLDAAARDRPARPHRAACIIRA